MKKIVLLMMSFVLAMTYTSCKKQDDLPKQQNAENQMGDQDVENQLLLIDNLLESGQYEEAIKALEKLAEAGNAKAQVKLGLIYYDGDFVEDNKKAFYWFTKAADQGNAEAQNFLGMMYGKGEGVPRDKEKAFYWYKKSADQGNIDGVYFLLCMYYDGDGIPQDIEKANYLLEKLEKLVEGGDPDKQCWLGERYYYGGVAVIPQNYTKAFYWFTKAAEQGLAKSQYQLGMMYYKGKGVSQDDEKGVYWIKKSAKGGNTDAQQWCREYGVKW